MKKLLLCLMVCLLSFPSALAEKGEIPDILRFTQEVQEREPVRENVYIQRTYPHSANPQVNTEVRSVIDAMVEAGRGSLPMGPITTDKTYLKVSAGISRTGQSWMSFLTLGRIHHDREQIYTDFDARAYDLADGRRLTMADLFDEDSEGWALLAQAVREQLAAYFPQEECDGAALDALCTREALAETPFTLTAGSLRLHYRADTLYPGRHTLMHVRLMYPDIRPAMTAEAQRQTDNSCYKLVAMTFDDGPAQMYSLNVADVLRNHGADATFFLVGNMLRQSHYALAHEHDAGFQMAYHSYTHSFVGNNYEVVHAEKARFIRDLNEVVGVTPTVMRAPGGTELPYVKNEIGMALLHWSVSCGDGTDNPTFDDKMIAHIAGNVGGGAQDGDVVLMHDLRQACWKYLEPTLNRLEERSFLCVTVDELFAAYGVPLIPNEVYYKAQ